MTIAFELMPSQFSPTCYMTCAGEPKKMNGLNCTCAVHRSWMYRATQGRVDLAACAIRHETGDCIEGTNLNQMQRIAIAHGMTTGKLYQPTSFDFVADLIDTGRYAAHLNIHYSVIAPTRFDCFSNAFLGNHDEFLSGRGSTAGTLRVGDPGADGRRTGIPNGFQNIPRSLLKEAAGELRIPDPDTGRLRALGFGKCYAYVTPADPPVGDRYRVAISGYTVLWNAPNGAKVGAVTRATYIATRQKIGGAWWYRIVSKADGSRTANGGLYFKPNSHTKAYAP